MGLHLLVRFSERIKSILAVCVMFIGGLVRFQGGLESSAVLPILLEIIDSPWDLVFEAFARLAFSRIRDRSEEVACCLA